MNTPRIFIAPFLAACIAGAQDNPAPAPAAAPAQSEMQKWMAATDAQWQAAFKRDVTDVHEADFNKLKLQYLNMLEEAIGKASKASDLDGAVALRNEQKRFSDTNMFPEQDEAGDATSVKQIRAAIRTQLAKLDKDSAIRIKALHVKYDQALAQAQAQLTQRQRLDDALLVKAKRDEVAAAWITPAIAAALENANPGRTAVAETQRPTISPTVSKKTIPFYERPVPARSVRVKVRIDGHDQIHYSDGKLWIEHLTAQKPMKITINGVPWEPVWSGNQTEPFKAFNPFPAPIGESRPKFKQITGRDKAKLEKMPAGNAQKTVTIDVTDVPAGDDIYEFQLSW